MDQILFPPHFEFVCSFNGYNILTHQTSDTAVPNVDANLFQFLRHPRRAIAAKAEARLCLDMGHNNHVHALPAAGRTAAEGPQATRADIHPLAQPVDRESTLMFFDEPEPHGFWLAKNTVVGSTGQRNGCD